MPETTSQTAVLVIDMQESVVDGCLDVDGVITRINDLLARARQVGAPVVFIQNEDPTDPTMTAGSPGWELAGALDRSEEDAVVAKRYRDSFADTELAAILDKAETQRLVVTGAHSDFCVQTTAMSAVLRGFDVTLVSDAHTARAHVLPTGGLDPETIVAFVNSRIGTLTYPGRTVNVQTAAEITL